MIRDVSFPNVHSRVDPNPDNFSDVLYADGPLTLLSLVESKSLQWLVIMGGCDQGARLLLNLSADAFASGSPMNDVCTEEGGWSNMVHG